MRVGAQGKAPWREPSIKRLRAQAQRRPAAGISPRQARRHQAGSGRATAAPPAGFHPRKVGRAVGRNLGKGRGPWGLPLLKKGSPSSNASPSPSQGFCKQAPGIALVSLRAVRGSGKRRWDQPVPGFWGWERKTRGFRGNGKSGKSPSEAASSASAARRPSHGGAEHAGRKFQQPFGIKQGRPYGLRAGGAKPGGGSENQLRHGGPNDACGRRRKASDCPCIGGLSLFPSSRWRMRIAVPGPAIADSPQRTPRALKQAHAATG